MKGKNSRGGINTKVKKETEEVKQEMRKQINLTPFKSYSHTPLHHGPITHTTRTQTQAHRYSYRIKNSLSVSLGLSSQLGHGVESGTVLEPLNLALVEGVRELGFPGNTVLGVDTERHGLAYGELGAHEVDLVVEIDLVVVLRSGESEGKETLLLQVGLVDTSERADDDSDGTKVAGLESSVLTGRPLSVVPVTNDNPLDALGLVVTGSVRDSAVLSSQDVADGVGLSVLVVDGADQHVVGDVVQVSTVLQPRTGH